MIRPALLLSLIAFAATTVFAVPAVKDLSTTTVDIDVPYPDPALAALSKDKDHVTVSVQRIDSLLDDVSGDLLAARIVDVGFKFDIDPAPDASHPVLVNSVPVMLGVSSVSVETTMVASAAIADVLPRELLELAFDVGLAKVDVTATEAYVMMNKDKDGWLIDPTTEKAMAPETIDAATAEMKAATEVGIPAVAVTNVPVRRITISVKVTEINGVKVEQMDLVEQIMDVLNNGSVIRRPPVTLPSTQDPVELAAMEARREAHRRHCMNHHRVAALWSRLPHGTRVAIAAFFGSLLILVFFVALPLAAYVHYKERSEGYSPLSMSEARLPTIPEEDEEENKVDEKAWLRTHGVTAAQAPATQ